jgi:hypothetical protein
VRRLVLGIDGQRQRFDGRQVQLGHLLRMQTFSLEPLEERTVRAIRQVQYGRDQQQAGDEPEWQLEHPRALLSVDRQPDDRDASFHLMLS